MKKGIKQLSELDRVVIKACERRIKSKDGREISVIEAMVNQDVPAALQGDDKAKKRLWADYGRASDRKAELGAADREWAREDQRKCFELFATAEGLGLPAPDLLPHPAHVRVTDDDIIITGPLTAEERASWEYTKAELRRWSDSVARLREFLRRHPGDEEARFRLRRIRALIERIRRTIPPGWDWKESIYTRGSAADERARYVKRLEERLDRASPELRRRIDQEVASWRIGERWSPRASLRKPSTGPAAPVNARLRPA